MAMRNTNHNFYGQQTGERILYVVKPHKIAMLCKLTAIYVIAVVVFLVFFVIGELAFPVRGILNLLGLTFGVLIAALGSYIAKNSQGRNISYITDRRMVRFEPTTLFATNIRTLSWDEAVKVKTFVPNMIWKQLAIGSVVIHARTAARVTESPVIDVSVDDIELDDVYYYRDLGNYIDKILFAYKQRPEEVNLIRPFVLKPKGQRF